MNISYRTINIIALVTLLPITSFGMQQQALSINSALLPEINKTIFSELNLFDQDRLRATCHYWKKMGDERSSYLLDLLHSPSNTTTQTKVRVLFDAVYNNNYDLAEHMLKITPEHHLNHPTHSNTILDLYYIAEKNNGTKTIELMEKYEHLRHRHNIIEYIEHPVLLELIVSCISGNSNSVKKIIDIEFKTDEVCNQIKKDNEYTQKTMWVIEDALDFAVFYDSEQCILAWKTFFKDPEVDWMIECLLKKACSFKSKKAFKALLQQKNNINEIRNGRYNGTSTKITLKNMILGGTVWGAHTVFVGNKQYRDEIEAMFNECGAKTYEELQAENNLEA